METSSVREALRFSAMLRQPKHVSKVEKYAYVEKIIKILGMSDFAEAIVGSPGQGLNVERRKLLSIGVELAARPSVLLFLDEPTTGLDSQSAYGVITFLRMLANSGQCVLCTIHQPSAILFQQFDRLLLLVEGGKTAYFGSIGSDSLDVVNYFEQHGARECGSEENPAEYIIEVVSQKSVDWAEVWRKSDENTMVAEQLEQMQRAADNAASSHPYGSSNRQGKVKEFAMPFQLQFFYVTMRILQQYWRTPKYVWDKLLLAIASSLYVHFSSLYIFFNHHRSDEVPSQIHWLHLLPIRSHHSRHRRHSFRCLYASCHHSTTHQPDLAQVCLRAGIIRSTRAALKDLLLACLPAIQLRG